PEDATLASNVAGGGQLAMGDDGVKSVMDYTAYRFDVGGESSGLYLQLAVKLELIGFVAPVTMFAAELASAQESVMLDGIGVLGGVNGADMQRNLGGGDASPAAEINEYTDGTGLVHVTWTGDWVVLSQD